MGTQFCWLAVWDKWYQYLTVFSARTKRKKWGQWISFHYHINLFLHNKTSLIFFWLDKRHLLIVKIGRKTQPVRKGKEMKVKITWKFTVLWYASSIFRKQSKVSRKAQKTLFDHIPPSGTAFGVHPGQKCFFRNCGIQDHTQGTQEESCQPAWWVIRIQTSLTAVVLKGTLNQPQSLPALVQSSGRLRTPWRAVLHNCLRWESLLKSPNFQRRRSSTTLEKKNHFGCLWQDKRNSSTLPLTSSKTA